jgi:hypothetical protein
MGAGVSVTAEQPSIIDKRLERESLFVTSLVSKMVDDAFPGRQVAVQARVKGNQQTAVGVLKYHFLESGKSDEP